MLQVCVIFGKMVLFVPKEELTVKRWMKYVKPYWSFFLLGPLCMIVEVIGEVLMPRYLARIINLAERGELTPRRVFGRRC